MNLLARSGRQVRALAIVSYRASRRYVALAGLGVTLVPFVSLHAEVGGGHLPPSLDGAESRRIHDLHLTYSRVEVNGSRIRWRVRLFRDDLEKTLQVFAHRPALDASTPAADSVFTAYFNARVRITSLGAPLTGAVVDSGRDPDSTDPQMWWYVVELRAPMPVRTLAIRVGLLFEHFADQRNVVTITKEPGGQRRSLYFAAGDTTGRTVF